MKIVAYADLHLFKVKDEMNRYISEELQDIKNKLINENDIDILVFCGDLTDTTYSSDDIRFIETINFISDIVKICESKKINFRMIQGTASHDGKIVHILKKIFADYKYSIFFTSVAYENFRGYSIRYLPESYFPTYSEFKQYAFGDKLTDITFFHGSVSGVIPYVKQKDSITNLPKSIVIEQDDLKEYNRLFSAGGHIHQHINIDDKIFYINSLTTTSFSDIDDIKGYMEFYLNGKEYEFKYVPNYKAPKYIDKIIENIHLLSNQDVKDRLNRLLLNISQRDHIRFTITGNKDFNGLSNLSLIKNHLKKYKFTIKTEMDEVELKNKLSQDIDFYTDTSITYAEKIKKLAEDNHGLELSSEEIEDIIYNK